MVEIGVKYKDQQESRSGAEIRGRRRSRGSGLEEEREEELQAEWAPQEAIQRADWVRGGGEKGRHPDPPTIRQIPRPPQHRHRGALFLELSNFGNERELRRLRRLSRVGSRQSQKSSGGESCDFFVGPKLVEVLQDLGQNGMEGNCAEVVEEINLGGCDTNLIVTTNHHGVCAICLNKIVLQETTLVKGCEHAYCVTCILRWASCKMQPTCPQCKTPFKFLKIHRSLDGSTLCPRCIFLILVGTLKIPHAFLTNAMLLLNVEITTLKKNNCE
ncbi:14 kDa zinc-binding protein [Phtheirospermum japonicum]|uniref:14 kDa zinc-binding protein n=1 Tax=Phtheirospermum japonicum TaxID=374723 RepID=A0A830CQC4_9LAMI|nr:14 kDa zinc-binding protein [Phtheirospermum japonicum]